MYLTVSNCYLVTSDFTLYISLFAHKRENILETYSLLFGIYRGLGVLSPLNYY